MADEATKGDTSKPARSAVAKMSAEECAEINKAIRRAVRDATFQNSKEG